MLSVVPLVILEEVEVHLLSHRLIHQIFEQKKEWKEKYDWKSVKHWLQPMLPTRYTQASCFKCHQNTSDLAGGEKNQPRTHID